ncbi:MAG: sulfotransferase [Sulfuritalea sp.]|nr:sulfotransferase [Sulfuritalea sp.]
MRKSINKRLIVVLGMHRSGTSVFAGVLQHLGVHFGDEQFGPNSWNERGYFEDRRIVELHERIFSAMGRRWNSIAPITQEELEKVQHLHREGVELLRTMSAGNTYMGIKDPRMCLLVPFWKAVFATVGLVPQYLFAIRDPREVAASLRDRDGISLIGGCWLWFTHVISALRTLDGDQCYFLRYEQLLEKPAETVRTISGLFELAVDKVLIDKIATEFVARDLNRHGEKEILVKDLPHPSVYALYKLLCLQESMIKPSPLKESIVWHNVEQTLVCTTPFMAFHDALSVADGQVTLLSGRLSATQVALAGAETLAFSRLKEVADLTDQITEVRAAHEEVQRLALDRLLREQHLREELERTQEAKADAERLALDRLVREQHLQEELERTQEAKANAEEIVRARDDALHSLSEQIDEVRAAHEEVQRLALDRLVRGQTLEEELERTQEAKANAEEIVRARDEALHSLTDQITEVRAAHEEVQRLALDRLVRGQTLEEELERTQEAKANAEEIVRARDEALHSLTDQITEVRAAHEEVQRLALDRLVREQRLEEELERTQEAKANAEEIVRARDEALHSLTDRITEVRAAHEEVQRLALDRLVREQRLENELERTQVAKADAEALVTARMEENYRLNMEFDALKTTLQVAYDTIARRESVITAIHRWPLWRAAKKLGLTPREKKPNE